MAYTLDPVRFARDVLGFRPDAVQERVLDPGVMQGILNCSRQWGKSTVTAVKALHRALYEAGSLTLIVSPSERQSSELVRKVREFARVAKQRVKGDGSNACSLVFANGSRIVGLPGNETTTRGFSAVSLLIVDEAARVSDVLYKSMRPVVAMGGRGRPGQVWLISTPKGKRGFFWETWELAGRPAGRDWVRIAVPATECSRFSKEFLERERAAVGEDWFRQEYLCEFVQADDCVFRGEDVRACMRKDVPRLFPGR